MTRKKRSKKKKEPEPEPIPEAVIPELEEPVIVVTATDKVEEPKIVKLEPITEEEPPTVKQPFNDPNTEESTDMNEEIIFSIAQLPTPLMAPTQRQYGEEFLPEYTKIRSKLRRLAGLANGLP